MTRSPLAYPLNRSVDADVGGAADLQTDIMRFMAILSLCLVAIFALVQSIPLTPAEPPPQDAAPTPVAQEITPPTPAPAPVAIERSAPKPVDKAIEKAVLLTRPTWQPKYTAEIASPPAAEAPLEDPPPSAPEKIGFTLRFASDAALMRAVAARHVGLYALDDQQAKRMTVSDSRISFWDASTPNSFHEMEATTVPAAVIDALGRTGVAIDGVGWGVTLPGKVKTQMNSLMENHDGGSLIIDAAGDVHWEEQ